MSTYWRFTHFKQTNLYIQLYKSTFRLSPNIMLRRCDLVNRSSLVCFIMISYCRPSRHLFCSFREFSFLEFFEPLLEGPMEYQLLMFSKTGVRRLTFSDVHLSLSNTIPSISSIPASCPCRLAFWIFFKTSSFSFSFPTRSSRPHLGFFQLNKDLKIRFYKTMMFPNC